MYVCVWGVVCVWEGVSEEKGNALGTRDQHDFCMRLLHAQDTPSPAAPHIPGNGEFSGNGDGFPSGGNAGYSRADLAMAGTRTCLPALPF